MSAMDMASRGSARVSYAQFYALPDYPQFADNDGGRTFTRSLAARDSADGPLFAVFASGIVADVIASHNERCKLTAARASAVKARDDAQAADPVDIDARERAKVRITAAEEQLDKLPKTRAVETYHVARTLSLADSMLASDGDGDGDGDGDE